MCRLLQTYYILSPLPKFGVLVEKEVHSWKKLDLNLELQCIILLSQIMKTEHAKFGTETQEVSTTCKTYPATSTY